MEGDYRLRELHLERLRLSAEYFGFSWDEARVNFALEQTRSQLRNDTVYKIRLLLDRERDVLIESIPLDQTPLSGTVVLAAIRTSSGDKFLYHKTTCRDLYDRLHAAARRHGHEDVIFLNERGEVTEGARNNALVEISGKLFTPPVECGLLPGVLRRHILETDGRASERILTVADLHAADAIYLCNSVRGRRRVRLIDLGLDLPA